VIGPIRYYPLWLVLIKLRFDRSALIGLLLLFALYKDSCCKDKRQGLLVFLFIIMSSDEGSSVEVATGRKRRGALQLGPRKKS
jgi:hypothetical protein